MAKNTEDIVLEGVIEAALPGGVFLVKLTSEGFEGHKIRAELSGKMRMHYIRIVLGDRVDVRVSEHDLEKGVIVYRRK